MKDVRSLARMAVPFVAVFVWCLVGPAREAIATPVFFTVGRQSPAPAIQGQPITFAYTLLNRTQSRFGGEITPEVVQAGCTLDRCRTRLPSIAIAQGTARVTTGRIVVPPQRGRSTYELHVQFQPSDAASPSTSRREFYVEPPDEQQDSFRNGVDVGGSPGPISFCDQTSFGYRFERDASDRLRVSQPYNQCTGQPQSGWRTFGGAAMGSAPSLALSGGIPSNSPNRRVHLFYRGRDGLLWTRVWDSKPFDGDVRSLGGPITSAPSALAPINWSGHVEVFYRDAGNQLVTMSLDEGRSWSGGKVLASEVNSAPASFSFREGIDVVVYRGANKHLWLLTRDRRTGGLAGTINNAAQWSSPVDLGGVDLRSSPGISTRSTSQEAVVEYRGEGDRVWESTWDGERWWSAPVNTGRLP